MSDLSDSPSQPAHGAHADAALAIPLDAPIPFRLGPVVDAVHGVAVTHDLVVALFELQRAHCRAALAEPGLTFGDFVAALAATLTAIAASRL